MAQYEHLPIYKKTMELAVFIENAVRGFERYHKYAIGTDLRKISKELVALVISANSSREKRHFLITVRDKKAASEGLPYVVIAEQGYYPSGLKKRVATEIAYMWRDLS